MKKILSLTLSVFMVLGLSSCGSLNKTSNGALIGAGGGAALGAGIGALIGGGKGAAIGAAVGTVAGQSDASPPWAGAGQGSRFMHFRRVCVSTLHNRALSRPQ